MAHVPHTAEHSYEELRQQAETYTGEVSSKRRIQEIECRYGGTDHLVRIGEPGAIPGSVVAAIFQLGRELFTIHHSQLHGVPDTPFVLKKKDVYSVAEFR
ncbi:MAG TPA: hypothetical protein VHT27_13935 [Solirubrobacteraceae bacterium]|jgi:hypothetical protein|nr:hypothetical protein [Solirubrobacteraceae bacterium]